MEEMFQSKKVKREQGEYVKRARVSEEPVSKSSEFIVRKWQDERKVNEG